MAERKIAFFVSTWASDPTLFAWTWLKQSFLRKTAYDSTNPNGFVLSEADILYVVHVSKGGDDEDTCLALARYPHKVVVLEAGSASLQSVMTEWIERHKPDVLVFGIREKGKPHKVVEYLRQHSTVPFLIVQPENVRNVRMRLSSDQDNGGRGSPTMLATSPPALATVAEADEEAAAPEESDEELDEALLFAGAEAAPASAAVEASTRPRKIAIAYENDATGQMLLAFATRVVLQAHDSVLLVHCMVGKKDGSAAKESGRDAAEGVVLSSSSKSIGSDGGSSKALHAAKDAAAGCMPRPGGVAGALERITTRRRLPKGDEHPPSHPHDPSFADELLQGFTVVHSVRLKGDPRQMLCKFAAQSGLDLLIMGSSGRSMLKRALTGIQSAKALKVLTAISPAHSSVSRYVISHAPCPVILVPFKPLGSSPTHAAQGEGDDDVDGLAQRNNSISGTPTGSSPPIGSSPPWQPGLLSREELVQLVEVQGRQLVDKDQQIAALRAQLRGLGG